MAISRLGKTKTIQCVVLCVWKRNFCKNILRYKIQNISSSGTSVCEPCAHVSAKAAATAFRSFVRVIIITTSNYLVLSFWGLNDKWCEIRQCQSQTVTLPRKLFSLFAPSWKSMYARWLPLPLNIQYTMYRAKETISPSQPGARAEEWKKKSMRMWNSGRLCELWATMMAHSRRADRLLLPVLMPANIRIMPSRFL